MPKYHVSTDCGDKTYVPYTSRFFILDENDVRYGMRCFQNADGFQYATILCERLNAGIEVAK